MLLFFAWLLAYLFKPVVAGITHVGLPFGGAVLLVYIVGPLVALVLGVLLVPAITEQAAGINAHLDEYTSKVSGLLNGAHGALTSFGLSAPDVGELEARVKGAAGSAGQAVLQGALNAVGGIGNALFQISLVLIFSVSFLVDGEQMARKPTGCAAGGGGERARPSSCEASKRASAASCVDSWSPRWRTRS